MRGAKNSPRSQIYILLNPERDSIESYVGFTNRQCNKRLDEHRNGNRISVNNDFIVTAPQSRVVRGMVKSSSVKKLKQLEGKIEISLDCGESISWNKESYNGKNNRDDKKIYFGNVGKNKGKGRSLFMFKGKRRVTTKIVWKDEDNANSDCRGRCESNLKIVNYEIAEAVALNTIYFIKNWQEDLTKNKTDLISLNILFDLFSQLKRIKLQ